MGKDQVAVLIIQLYPEHRIGQSFPDNSLNFNRFFFRHTNSFCYSLKLTCVFKLLPKKQTSVNALALHTPALALAYRGA
jgi:hypothetical protein